MKRPEIEIQRVWDVREVILEAKETLWNIIFDLESYLNTLKSSTEPWISQNFGSIPRSRDSQSTKWQKKAAMGRVIIIVIVIKLTKKNKNTKTTKYTWPVFYNDIFRGCPFQQGILYIFVSILISIILDHMHYFLNKTKQMKRTTCS